MAESDERRHDAWTAGDLYEPYVGRNPKTGAAIEVKAKTIPFFKVGKELKERVNEGKVSANGDDGDDEE